MSTYDIVCHTKSYVNIRYRMFTHDIVCLHMISYVNIEIVYWLRHRQYTMLYNIQCCLLDVRYCTVCLQGTAQRFQIFPRPPPAQGVGKWAESLLRIAPIFRPSNQYRRVRNTAFLYCIKHGYSHTLYWWPRDQWTVHTVPYSLPWCQWALLYHSGCSRVISPSYPGGWKRGVLLAQWRQPDWNCCVCDLCGPLHACTVATMDSESIWIVGNLAPTTS